jgi:beta-glucosidase
VFAEPKPVWQCNADNVCAATADGSDLDVATALAKEADVVVTLLASFAIEGNDRASLSFDAQLDGSCQLSAPGQDSLVNVLAATGAHIVVAAVAPGAMVAPWKDSVDAILHGFMPGQEYGSALADVLFGKVNPSAKLTLTMPNVENEVGFTPDEYPGNQLVGTYTEKMNIGYRWYNTYNVKPAFAFGHGLSYTKFTYSQLNVTMSSSSREGTISAMVTNAGPAAGREVAQLYVTFPESANTPKLQLKGFVKTASLAPKESVRVDFAIKSRDLRVWDDVSTHNWANVHGVFHFGVGAASDDLRLQGKFEL